MNPKAPKIRHLNASHPLLIELEENVQKVQELEHKVLELERQLQFRELMKKQQRPAEKVEPLNTVEHHKTVIKKEDELAFRKRLEEAKKKAALLSLKRNEEEEKIMRSYQQNKLMLTINQLSKISEEDYNAVKLLDKPAEVDGNAVLFSDIEALVDLVHKTPDRSLLEEEFLRLQEMLAERDSLVKLFAEIQEKYDQTLMTITEVQNTISNVNAIKVNRHANLNMSSSLLKVMQGRESRRRNQNIFVFGPNPIFNSAKELELTSLVSDKNLKSAKECKKKYKASRAQVQESLHSLQESIDQQTIKINDIQQLLDSPTVGPRQDESFSSKLQSENMNTQEI